MRSRAAGMFPERPTRAAFLTVGVVSHRLTRMDEEKEPSSTGDVGSPGAAATTGVGSRPGGPGSQGWRAEKKERTRRVLVDVSLDLFERHGYDATSVEEVAAAGGVSPRTVFRYF